MGLAAPFFSSTAAAVGPLEQMVSDTYRLGNYLDSCDLTTTQKNIRLDLARAIDDRQLDFEDYANSSQRTNRYNQNGNELRVGPLSLSPRPEPSPNPSATPGVWTSKISGWEDFDREYQALRGSRVGPRWLRLRDSIRATVNDDYRRGVRGVWMRLSQEGVTEAATLVNLVTACLNEQKCDDLQKSETFKNALNLTPNSASDFGNYRKASLDSEREKALKNLLGEVKPFVKYFDPVKQRGVRKSDDHSLIISLDVGEFRGYETDLALLIERFWKVGEDSLKIEWMTSLRDEPLFRFLFSPTPGSQINHTQKTITLGQWAIESIPAHEVGRALGFRPRYFPVWRPDLCKYEDQSRTDDILSDGRTGLVDATHWDALKRTYQD